MRLCISAYVNLWIKLSTSKTDKEEACIPFHSYGRGQDIDFHLRSHISKANCFHFSRLSSLASDTAMCARTHAKIARLASDRTPESDILTRITSLLRETEQQQQQKQKMIKNLFLAKSSWNNANALIELFVCIW